MQSDKMHFVARNIRILYAKNYDYPFRFHQVIDRDVNRGQMLEAKAEAEAKFNRPSPRPELKWQNRTLYFTMKN